MKKVYILGITLSTLILTINQIFIQYWLATKKDDAQQINIAGKQRMLSQKVNLEFYQIFYDSKPNTNLKVLFKEWKSSHNTLLYGNKKHKIEAITDQKARKKLFHLKSKITFIEKYINNPINFDKAALQKITQNQNAYLQEMNQAVKDLEIAADKKLNFIIFIEIFLTVLALLLLSLEVFLIYMPMSLRLKKMTTTLKQDNYKLEALENSRASGIAFIDTDLKIQYMNTCFKETHEMVIGRKPRIGDLSLEFVLSEDEIETENIYRKVLAGETLEYVRSYQQRHWLFELYPIYNKKKEVEGISHSLKEITEKVALQKDKDKLEKRIKIIAENFPGGSITLVDKDLNIQYTNGEEYSKAGIDPRRYIGRSIHKFLTKKQLDQLLENMEKVQKGSTISYEVEYLSNYYLVKLKPILEKNEVIKIVIITSNITPLVERQNEILAKNRRLEAYADYNSHILRAPITRLLGLSELLLELDFNQEETQKLLQHIRSSSKLLDEVSRHLQSILDAKDDIIFRKLMKKQFDFET